LVYHDFFNPCFPPFSVQLPPDDPSPQKSISLYSPHEDLLCSRSRNTAHVPPIWLIHMPATFDSPFGPFLVAPPPFPTKKIFKACRSKPPTRAAQGPRRLISPSVPPSDLMSLSSRAARSSSRNASPITGLGSRSVRMNRIRSQRSFDLAREALFSMCADNFRISTLPSSSAFTRFPLGVSRKGVL